MTDVVLKDEGRSDSGDASESAGEAGAEPAISLRKQYITLFVLGVVIMFTVLDRQILALMIEPIKADYGISDTQAALLLGAERAVGTDIDVQALEASRDNAGRNGIDPARFPLYLPEQLPQGQADVVVANILAGPLVALAPRIIERVKPGGRLALSGILREQAEEVRSAYTSQFDLDPTAEKDGWVRITGVRRR